MFTFLSEARVTDGFFSFLLSILFNGPWSYRNGFSIILQINYFPPQMRCWNIHLMFSSETYFTCINSVQNQWKQVSGINGLVYSWLQSYLATENNLKLQMLLVLLFGFDFLLLLLILFFFPLVGCFVCGFWVVWRETDFLSFFPSNATISIGVVQMFITFF